MALKFNPGNAKIDDHSFSLPAGYSCPSALDCLSKADRATGHLTDGESTQYRCFAASSEALFPNTRSSRWSNFDQLRKMSKWEMVQAINAAIPNKALGIRIHVSGDFFNQDYFDAWVIVATLNPNIHFYAYTKAIDFWGSCNAKIPDNLNLTGSYGGTHDGLLRSNPHIKTATVVYHPDEAKELGLKIDHDDSLAKYGTESFALLLHGVQPAKSEASKAQSRMRREGIKFSYNRKGKK